jgi:hypothetical protein
MKMEIKLLKDDKKPLLQEINDDYFSTLKKELSCLKQQYVQKEITKSYLRNIIKKEILTANGYRLKYEIELFEGKKAKKKNSTVDNNVTDDILLKVGNPREKDRIIKETLPVAIKCLEKYRDHLLELMRSLDKSKVDIAKGTKNSSEKQEAFNSPNLERLEIALKDAVDNNYLCPDMKTVPSGVGLKATLLFLFKKHKISLKKDEVFIIFLKQKTGLPYDETYCARALSAVRRAIRETQQETNEKIQKRTPLLPRSKS